MSLAHGFSAYITLNALVVAGCLGLMVYSVFVRVAKRKIAAGVRLKLHYAVLSMLLFILLLYPLLPGKEAFKPAIKILSGQSTNTLALDYSEFDDGGYLNLSGLVENDSLDVGDIKLAGIILISVLLLVGTGKMSYDLYRLYIIRKKSYLIRRYGKIYIFANDLISVPFSYWLPGQTNIVIPTTLAGKDPYFKVTLLHEIQHHRNGDTKWIYVVWFLRTLCVINPFIHLWNRTICELQEFACDETLIDRKRIDSQVYARCLYEAAKAAVRRMGRPVCATGLAFMVQRRLLKRRIENMYIGIQIKPKRCINLMVLILIMVLMTSVASASKGTVQDSRMTKSQTLKTSQTKANNDFSTVTRGNKLVAGIYNSHDTTAKFVVENKTTFGLPIKEGKITASFGNIKHPYTKKIWFHTGIDIAAPLGTKVLAVTEGTVVEIVNEFKENEGAGKYIILQHANGYTTRYTHLQDIFVSQGQQISAGQDIASVGNTGLSTGPHLHFEVLLNGKPMDPIDYIEIENLKPLKRYSELK